MAKIRILNRWTGAVVFESEQPDTLPIRRRRGEAILAALAAKIDLRDSNLSGSNLSDSDLSGSDLSGSDLRGSDLRGSDLSDSDLRGSTLSDSNLSDSNLSGFAGIYIPKLGKPNTQILAAIESDIPTRFDMRHVHQCETTHCRAGWLIHLTGEAGKVLESCLGWEAAAALIHVANCPAAEGKVPDFHCGDAEALADIRRLAALEV